MNAAKTSEERITVKKWIVYGLTLALLGFSATGCSNLLANTSASPTVGAPLVPRPLGTVRIKRILRLTRKPPDQLLVVSTTKKKATMAVYTWNPSEWMRRWSESWIIGYTPPQDAQFSYIGARPLMGPYTDEVVTNYWSTGGDAGAGKVTVWRWTGRSLKNTLSLDDFGSLSAILRKHELMISGEYYKNMATCMACGINTSASITYQHHWESPSSAFFHELVYGIPPAPKPTPTLTFGSGFNDATFALTGVHSTFPAGTIVHWLLDDPSPFNTSSLNIQLYEQNGAAEQLMGSSTITTNPQFGEEDASLGAALAAGTYQLIVLIHNKVLASGTFTIG